MSLMIGDCVSRQIASARSGTAKLLAALQVNHDANMTLPKGWKPKPKPVVVPPPKAKLWFSVDEPLQPAEPKIGDIRRATCRHFNMSNINLISQRRTSAVVYPRQLAMYVARELTSRSLPEIGRQFGGRDHTTVLHGTRKIAAKVRSDWKVAYDVAHVEALLA